MPEARDHLSVKCCTTSSRPCSKLRQFFLRLKCLKTATTGRTVRIRKQNINTFHFSLFVHFNVRNILKQYYLRHKMTFGAKNRVSWKGPTDYQQILAMMEINKLWFDFTSNLCKCLR